LDEYIVHFTEILVKMNPEALSLLKEVFWKETAGWDQLLVERAEMSGKLILSDYAKDAIQGFLKA